MILKITKAKIARAADRAVSLRRIKRSMSQPRVAPSGMATPRISRFHQPALESPTPNMPKAKKMSATNAAPTTNHFLLLGSNNQPDVARAFQSSKVFQMRRCVRFKSSFCSLDNSDSASAKRRGMATRMLMIVNKARRLKMTPNNNATCARVDTRRRNPNRLRTFFDDVQDLIRREIQTSRRNALAPGPSDSG